MALTVYGIPNCGTVKKARAWLDARGQHHGWVDFRATPLSRERVGAWVEALGAKALRNTAGRSYRSLGPERNSWTEAEWADAFAADPMLIKRPVIERGGTAVLAGFRGADDVLSAKLGL